MRGSMFLRKIRCGSQRPLRPADWNSNGWACVFQHSWETQSSPNQPSWFDMWWLRRPKSDAPWLLPHNLMSILLRGWELLVTLKLKKLSCQFCLSQGLVFDVLKSLTARRNGFGGSKLCGFRSFRSSLRLWAAELAFQSIHVASDMTRRGQGTEFVGCPKRR